MHKELTVNTGQQTVGGCKYLEIQKCIGINVAFQLKKCNSCEGEFHHLCAKEFWRTHNIDYDDVNNCDICVGQLDYLDPTISLPTQRPTASPARQYSVRAKKKTQIVPFAKIQDVVEKIIKKDVPLDKQQK